jgi:DNA repair protein RecO (recombination protein O)
MDRFVEPALVLSTVDYGDADRLVTLLTQSRGKLTAFAAGARKSKRRFAGALEPFTLVRARLVERRGDTFRLDEAEIDRCFLAVRSDLPLIARAMYSVELCRELTRDREPHPELFALLLAYLESLEKGAADEVSLLGFELSALAHAGLAPRFSPCSICGKAAHDPPDFDPEHGGVLCASCRSRGRLGLRMLPGLATALGELQQGMGVTLSARERASARELLNHFIAHQLGKRLKSVAFLTQLGVD